MQELIRETKRMTPVPTDAALERDLSRLSVRAGLALWWELLWPALVPLLGVGALFVAASWIGLFASLPHWARLGGLALTAAALLVALMPLARIVPPGRAERLRRVDRDSEARHGLASAWADRLGAGAADGATRTLWQAHRHRLREGLAGARVAWPRPGMVARDRYALRVAPLLILAAAFFAAGPNRLERIAAALDPQASPAPAVEGAHRRLDRSAGLYADAASGDRLRQGAGRHARAARAGRLDAGAALAGRGRRQGATL